MAKSLDAADRSPPKPKVVFDLKMPQYHYQSASPTLKVKRRKASDEDVAAACLGNLLA